MKFRQRPLALLCLFIVGCTSDAKKPIDPANQTAQPKLLAPSVKKIWLPAHMKEGGQDWEEGHYLYRIDRGVSWSR